MNEDLRPQKAKGCLIALVAIAVVIACASHLVTSSEAIPDRAKFVFDRNLQIIIPCPEPGAPAFFPVPGKFDTKEGSLSSKWDGVTTWAEVKKKDGPFSGFDLPDAPGWDTFVFHGKPIPLWKSVLFKPESRWDADGYWRY